MPIDLGIKGELDGYLLPRPDVSSKDMFGGSCYLVNGKMFSFIMEGAVVMKLPEEARSQALTMASVSPFRLPARSGRFGKWLQFTLALPQDVPGVIPWLEQAHDYVNTLPRPRQRRRKAAKHLCAL